MKPTVWALVEQIGTDADPRVIDRDDIEAFIERYDDHSPSYVKNEYVRVGAFLRWVAKKYKGSVDLSCLDVDNLPRDDSAGREIPDMTTAKAALRKLSAHGWLGEYVTVLLETGMRPSELLAVRGVDLNGNLLSIEPWGEWSPKSKWSKRVIQLNETATRILEARKKGLFDKRAPLFGLPEGKMRSVKHTSKLYRSTLGDATEFDLCNLYVWKHLFCSEHAAPGPAFMELQTLAAYIGHAPGSTRVLERWYANRNAMRRGSPPALTIEAKETKVVPMKAT
jgi:integrase